MPSTPCSEHSASPRKPRNTALVFACLEPKQNQNVTLGDIVTQTGLRAEQVHTAVKHLRYQKKEDITRHRSSSGDYFVYQGKMAEKKERKPSYRDVFRLMGNGPSAR